jgi:hypothetical protein
MTRKSFRRYRRELASKGFLRIENSATGLCSASEDWRAYTPTADELERLAQHDAARQARIECTCKSRGSILPPGTSRADTRGSKVPPGDADSQGVKTAHLAGGQDGPLFNTPLRKEPPLPPSLSGNPESSQAVGGGFASLGNPDGEADPQGREPEEAPARFVDVEGERVQVWPMPRFTTATALLAWGQKVQPHLTPEEYAAAIAEFDRLEAAELAASKNGATASTERAFVQDWNKTAREINAANGSMAKPEARTRFAGCVCRALGDDSTRARRSISESMRGIKPSLVREVAQQLLDELATPSHGIQNPVGVLVHRMKRVAS